MVRYRQQDYYKALKKAGADGESTVFIVFICTAILEAMHGLQAKNDRATDQVRKLINILPDGWHSAAEMMRLRDLSHKPTFRKNCLEPALHARLLEMRFPDTPRNPKQKYRRVGGR